MKSTALDATNNADPGAAALAWSDRYKALPFLTWMLVTGMPLNYQLHAARPMAVSEVAEQTLEAAASGNAFSSVPFALFLGGLYFASGWMLLKKPKAVLAILSRQWPLVFIAAYIAASVFWSFAPEKVLSNTVHNIGALFICIAAALRYRHDPWLFPKQLGYALGLNLVVQLVAVAVIPTYSIDWQGRWQGVTPHPNTFGALAFTALWANAVILICKREPDKYHLHLIFSGLAVAAMAGANSVTSMMASGCVILAIYTLKALQKLNAGRRFYLSVFGIGTSVALVVYMLGSALDLSALFGLFGRDANLTGRTSVWADAYSAISTYPILGWSFDDHAYIIKTRSMPYTSYHNGFLDVAVSGGAISMVLLILLLINWIAAFGKGSLTAAQIAIFSASFGFAFLVHNLTEASLLSPRGHMWMVFTVLLCLGSCRRAFALNGNFELGARGLFAHQGPTIQQPPKYSASG